MRIGVAVLLVSAATLAVALAVLPLLYIYVERRAVDDLARQEARQLSKLVFESLYSAMSKGLTHDELHDHINRLTHSRSDLQIQLFRGEPVVREFGDARRGPSTSATDPALRRALAGETVLEREEDALRYLYPIQAQAGCLQCHTQTRAGQTNGVVAVTYPLGQLKVSLSFVRNTAVAYLIAVLLTLLVVFYLKAKYFIARPVDQLTQVMRQVTRNLDIDRRVETSGGRIHEVGLLAMYFDRLLEALAHYRERIIEYAVRDPLTGLFNRRKFTEMVKLEVERSLRHQRPFALLMLDLDNFKSINDAQGYPVGDLALKQLAAWLASATRTSDLVARLGGDEFAVLLPETDLDGGLTLAAKLREALAETVISLPRGEARLSASFGLVCFPHNGADHHKLTSAMDMALFKAKRQGRNRVATLDPHEEVEMTGAFSVGQSVRDALEHDRLTPFFQPIVDVQSGTIIAYEVLARIVEGNEVVAAGQFIQLAEQMGLSEDVDERIFDKALQLVGTIADTGVKLFFNFSPKTLANAERMRSIPAQLKQQGFDPSRVVVEITEREALPHLNELIRVVDELRSHGIGFALDDFGSGFSSFLYLKYLPVDYVKIEGSFIRHIANDNKDRVMVEHIANMAKRFGLTTVAEFVEDEQTHTILRDLGIELGQGHHYGHPAQMPASRLAASGQRSGNVSSTPAVS